MIPRKEWAGLTKLNGFQLYNLSYIMQLRAERLILANFASNWFPTATHFSLSFDEGQLTSISGFVGEKEVPMVIPAHLLETYEGTDPLEAAIDVGDAADLPDSLEGWQVLHMPLWPEWMYSTLEWDDDPHLHQTIPEHPEDHAD